MHGEGRWVEVDAGGSVEEVREEMGRLVDALSERKRGGGEKGKLWTV